MRASRLDNRTGWWRTTTNKTMRIGRNFWFSVLWTKFWGQPILPRRGTSNILFRPRAHQNFLRTSWEAKIQVLSSKDGHSYEYQTLCHRHAKPCFEPYMCLWQRIWYSGMRLWQFFEIAWQNLGPSLEKVLKKFRLLQNRSSERFRSRMPKLQRSHRCYSLQVQYVCV